jgi:hypothetical protein
MRSPAHGAVCAARVSARQSLSAFRSSLIVVLREDSHSAGERSVLSNEFSVMSLVHNSALTTLH